jgi:hypothetical protein
MFSECTRLRLRDIIEDAARIECRGVWLTAAV